MINYTEKPVLRMRDPNTIHMPLINTCVSIPPCPLHTHPTLYSSLLKARSTMLDLWYPLFPTCFLKTIF